MVDTGLEADRPNRRAVFTSRPTAQSSRPVFVFMPPAILTESVRFVGLRPIIPPAQARYDRLDVKHAR